MGPGDELWPMLEELCSVVLPNVDWTCGGGWCRLAWGRGRRVGKPPGVQELGG